MPVHLGQPRHEIETVAIDHLDAFLRPDLINAANCDDPPVVNDDGLIFEDAVAIHRKHVDVDERHVPVHERIWTSARRGDG